MRNQNRSVLEFAELVEHPLDRRRPFEHPGGDSRVAGDEARNPARDAHERVIARQDDPAAHALGAHLEDAMATAVAAVGLEIKDDELHVVDR